MSYWMPKLHFHSGSAGGRSPSPPMIAGIGRADVGLARQQRADHGDVHAIIGEVDPAQRAVDLQPVDRTGEQLELEALDVGVAGILRQRARARAAELRTGQQGQLDAVILGVEGRGVEAQARGRTGRASGRARNWSASRGRSRGPGPG